MREILFRGKTENGLWRIGYLSFEDKITIKRKCYDYKGDYVTTSIEEYKIDKNTVGQFTGLTDKNGKKIFEGDILEDILCGDKERYSVVFDEYLRYMITNGKSNYLLSRNNKDMEVVGNIHDNPKLLGE